MEKLINDLQDCRLENIELKAELSRIKYHTKNALDYYFEFAVKGMKAQAEVNKLCHQGDPKTSYEAAKKMVESGELSKQEYKVYRAILSLCNAPPIFHSYNDFTAKDIAKWWGSVNYYTIQRRLSGLRNKGKIERTGEKRDGCCVWRLL